MLLLPLPMMMYNLEIWTAADDDNCWSFARWPPCEIHCTHFVVVRRPPVHPWTERERQKHPLLCGPPVGASTMHVVRELELLSQSWQVCDYCWKLWSCWRTSWQHYFLLVAPWYKDLQLCDELEDAVGDIPQQLLVVADKKRRMDGGNHPDDGGDDGGGDVVAKVADAVAATAVNGGIAASGDVARMENDGWRYHYLDSWH